MTIKHVAASVCMSLAFATGVFAPASAHAASLGQTLMAGAYQNIAASVLQRAKQKKQAIRKAKKISSAPVVAPSTTPPASSTNNTPGTTTSSQVVSPVVPVAPVGATPTPPPVITPTPPAVVAPQPKVVNLHWSVPSTRLSGVPFAASDLAGYDLTYYGRNTGKSGVIQVSGTVTSYVFTGLVSDTYDFAISAYDKNGNSSPLSNVVTVTVTP